MLRFCWVSETYVRADGAFIPFWEQFDLRKVTTRLKGIGNMGQAYIIDLNDPISSLVGRPVSKVLTFPIAASIPTTTCPLTFLLKSCLPAVRPRARLS